MFQSTLNHLYDYTMEVALMSQADKHLLVQSEVIQGEVVVAKPRVFVSSTYYDLRHVRERIEDFVNTMGYEAVLFESGDIPFRSDVPLDHSCYAEIQNCHLLVLIIGGRYGSPASGDEPPDSETERDEFFKHYNSITKEEYDTAIMKDIPVFIFVDSGVMGEYQTFKKNRNSKAINYAHVDSINIFLLLDGILSQARNNFVKAFSRLDDITSWLREQWAGLFSDMLLRQQERTRMTTISTQLEDLKAVTEGLKKYSDEMLRSTLGQRGIDVIAEEENRLRKLTIRRFARTPMIKHLLRRESSNEEPRTPEQLYTALEESESLRSFLESIGSTELIDDWCAPRSFALRDYIGLRNDYFDIDPSELPISALGLSPVVGRMVAEAGIRKISELLRMDPRRIVGIGPERASEIKHAMRSIIDDS